MAVVVAEAVAVVEAGAAGARKRMRILLVEDDNDLQRLLKKALSPQKT